MAHIVLQLTPGKDAEPKVAYFLWVSQIAAHISIAFLVKLREGHMPMFGSLCKHENKISLSQNLVI